jgi:hypothetical protein
VIDAVRSAVGEEGFDGGGNLRHELAVPIHLRGMGAPEG